MSRNAMKATLPQPFPSEGQNPEKAIDSSKKEILKNIMIKKYERTIKCFMLSGQDFVRELLSSA